MTELLQPGGIARRDWLRLFAGGVAVGVLSAATARAEGAASAVTIDNFAFTPFSLTVKPGSTVTWTNRDDIPHVVMLTDLKLRSKTLDTDETFSHRFDAAGKFDYFCALHPHMKGTVTVSS
jgi:plastocyanin